jgi:hypothetical protein
MVTQIARQTGSSNKHLALSLFEHEFQNGATAWRPRLCMPLRDRERAPLHLRGRTPA